jgi:FKBP-type peptidyl-prolyl cis-trans isomerase FklB
MKRALAFLPFLALSFGLCAAGEAPEIRDDSDRIGYSIGYQIGGDFRRQGVELRPDLVVKGIRDAVDGANPLMTPEEMSRTLVELKRRVTAAQQEDARRTAERNRAAGEAFLAENAKKDGVVTLPSGLQYKVVKQGEGAPPGATDNVSVHYRGTLVDGTEFDSSYRRNRPSTFPVNGVIRGWAEALQLMKPGAKWQLFIPANLAYGDRGAGSVVLPGSALIFEVELISVNGTVAP